MSDFMPSPSLGKGYAPLYQIDKRKRHQAAKVPAAEADQLIESDDPPTVKQLAELGRSKRPQPIKPSLYRDEWADWIFPIKTLSTIPACGLAS